MTHSVLLILVAGAVTFLIRALPFLLFPAGKTPPALISRLTAVLPPAVMAMLIVYCLKNMPVTGPTHGLPELLAVAGVSLLHLWRRNTLLSILGGTVLYMVLVQLVF